MAEKPTASEAAAEIQGRAIDGRIFRIDEELRELAKSAERITELQAERAELVKSQTEVNAKRQKKAANEVRA